MTGNPRPIYLVADLSHHDTKLNAVGAVGIEPENESPLSVLAPMLCSMSTWECNEIYALRLNS
jgi:hypothetical protein